MSERLKPRPLWRWWLFCAVLSLWWRVRLEWLGDIMNWCVKPEWLGCDAPFERLDRLTGRDLEDPF